MTSSDTVEVLLWAAAAAAAGTDRVEVPPGTVAEVLDAARAGVPPDRTGRFDEVAARCSYLLDSVAVHDLSSRVPAGSRLDVLPPFAGG
jgi:molybdopterin converting factor small subunit